MNRRVWGAAAAVVAAGGVVIGVSAAGADGGSVGASCATPSYDGTTLTLTCTVPQATVTETATTTATATETATATVTATQTVTVTPTPTTPDPTPTPTTTPPPGFYASGEARNATNTGLAGDNITPSQLTASGSVTYGTAYNGQTISLKAYTGEVDITGSNITIKDCTVTRGGLNSFGIRLAGSNNTVQNCKITAPAGQSLYEPVFINPGSDGNKVLNNDISRGENLLTTYGTHAVIAGNYMHDVALDSDPSDHPDGIEVYGGGPVAITNNRIEEDNQYDAPVNAAPWGSFTLTDMTVSGNFIDGGQSVILLDNQNANGFIRNTRVTGNAFGGHQCPASNSGCFHVYHPLLNSDGRATVQTEADLAANPNAVLWPTSGAGVNKWEECDDLTPNRNGEIVTSA